MNASTLVENKSAFEKLIRPHLRFDEDEEAYRAVKTIEEIVSTHGATIAAVGRLAREGRFTGGSRDAHLQGEFFTNPNPRFRAWTEFDTGAKIAQRILGYEQDAILKAIEYSADREVADIDATYVDPPRESSYGVVITFGKQVLGSGVTISEDLLRPGLELVLPEAPPLQTIEGIYPVDAVSADELSSVLKAL